MTRKTTAVGVLTAAALLTGYSGAAHAAPAGPTPGPGSPNLRATAGQDCKLVTDLQPVVTDLLGVINGGPDTRGSVAWLNDRAAKAKDAGHPKAAAWLAERATVRQEQGAILTTRQQMLNQAAAWCQEHGFPANP